MPGRIVTDQSAHHPSLCVAPARGSWWRWLPFMFLLNLPACGPGGPFAPQPRPLPDADTAFTNTDSNRDATPRGNSKRGVLQISVISVQIPTRSIRSVTKVWDHLREDVIPGDTALRLRDNGLRVGISSLQWWNEVKSIFEAVDGHRALNAGPSVLQRGAPLQLDLDNDARDQTVFYLAPDGILSGHTLPASRNSLRLTWLPDSGSAEGVRVSFTPLVTQDSGWRWVKTDAGVAQAPGRDEHAYPAGAFTISASPDEFILLAPGENARLFGMLGGVLLRSRIDEVDYSTFIFLRPEWQPTTP